MAEHYAEMIDEARTVARDGDDRTVQLYHAGHIQRGRVAHIVGFGFEGRPEHRHVRAEQ